MRGFAFDPVAPRRDLIGPQLIFVPEAVGPWPQTTPPYQATLDQQLAAFAQDWNGEPQRVIVKMDIECGEWAALETASDGALDRIVQLVVEWHQWTDNPTRTIRLWDRLREAGFLLVHIHGNNYGGLVSVGGHVLPQTLEATYLRWPVRGCEAWQIARLWPLPIDRPNNPADPDLEFATP